MGEKRANKTTVKLEAQDFTKQTDLECNGPLSRFNVRLEKQTTNTLQQQDGQQDAQHDHRADAAALAAREEKRHLAERAAKQVRLARFDADLKKRVGIALRQRKQDAAIVAQLQVATSVAAAEYPLPRAPRGANADKVAPSVTDDGGELAAPLASRIAQVSSEAARSRALMLRQAHADADDAEAPPLSASSPPQPARPVASRGNSGLPVNPSQRAAVRREWAAAERTAAQQRRALSAEQQEKHRLREVARAP